MKPAHELDYLIIGSGASGATAAVVLSEQGYRVGVLEVDLPDQQVVHRSVAEEPA